LKTIITMTNNLTDTIFNNDFDFKQMQFRVSKLEYVVRTLSFDVNTLL